MRRLSFLLAVAFTSVAIRLPAAEFLGLGDLAGGKFSSEAWGISADGKTVVGRSSSEASGEFTQAFRWTKASGMVPLPDPAGGDPYSEARAASGDGSKIVGVASTEDLPFNEAVLWTGGSVTGLGALDGRTVDQSQANDISTDGSVVVGTSLARNPSAVRWTAANGLETLGSLLGPTSRSEAIAVSGDGTTIVGTSASKASGLFGEAFRWTEGEGMVGLGHLHAGDPVGSIAYDVSSDGSTIVGSSSLFQAGGGLVKAEAFRWTEDSGLVGLGDLPGGNFFSTALGVSGDGKTIVGQASGGQGLEAVIWDENNQLRSLRDVLVQDHDLGASLAGWRLTSATSISADGLAIAGVGVNPDNQTEAWFASLLVPALPGDANGDGKVNLADFIILRSNFGTGTTLSEGDFNGDGKVDFADFTILKFNFGKTAAATFGAAAAAVPEPGTIVLLALGGLGALIAVAQKRRLPASSRL